MGNSPTFLLLTANSSLCRLSAGTDLQVVVVPVGVDLVPSVHIEHRVQTLGGAGVLFKLLHLRRDKQ